MLRLFVINQQTRKSCCITCPRVSRLDECKALPYLNFLFRELALLGTFNALTTGIRVLITDDAHHPSCAQICQELIQSSLAHDWTKAYEEVRSASHCCDGTESILINER